MKKITSSRTTTYRRRRNAILALALSASVASNMSLCRMTVPLLLYLGTSPSIMGTDNSNTVDAAPMKTSGGERDQYYNGDEDDDDLIDDDFDEDLLLDYDSGPNSPEEDITLQNQNPTPPVKLKQNNPKLKLRRSSTSQRGNGDDDEQHHSSKENNEENDSVIILSAVDGTLAGISRASGRVLWRQSRDQIANISEGKKKWRSKKSQSPSAPIEWNKFLSPLVSTSTKSPNIHQWHAVPSVDGTVYLTSGTSGSGANANDGDENNNDDSSGSELSMSTNIRDLVDRSPFVDAQQRFFVGSRKAMVAAIDERTGEILRVIPKWKPKDGEEGVEGEEEEDLPPSLEGRDVVWIGRLEHTVTVHDLQKGTVDIEFSVAEILSVDEMIHGNRRREQHHHQHTGTSSLVMPEEGEIAQRQDEDKEMERLFTDYIAEALRHPNFGDRILRLPAPPDKSADGDGEEDIYANARGGGSTSISQGSPFVVSTPSGNVAFRDDSDSSTVGWVSFDLLASPVVYAIEGSSGRKIRVTMLDDVSDQIDSNNKDHLPQLLEQQIASIEKSTLSANGMIDEACSNESKSGECRAVGFSAQGSVVGALQNGQFYALPLGERISRPQTLPLGLPQPHSVASEMVNAHEYNKQAEQLNIHHIMGFHEHRHDTNVDDIDVGDGRPIHLDYAKNKQCTPDSPLYPGCIIPMSLMMGNLLDSSDLEKVYLDMLVEAGNSRKRNASYIQQFIKIMSSWIAPTVALIFVMSFEMGRRARERRKKLILGQDGSNAIEEQAKEGQISSNGGQGGGVIQLSDEILGYGGHGTIVYKGILDGRNVAVKRLLATYHASADREISLLIESDGHPNVVRYFLKEMRGDFVYLALELCDMSLNDLIVSLSKLRNVRKENFQLSTSMGKNDLESATKNMLFQIASGVRHIHSLRIVHRDLKPQNILLALRGSTAKHLTTKSDKGGGSGGSSDSETEADDTTHTTCSDTNTMLEYFKDQEYVPKISDMGLGKQLAGQSSFGLSTLGTGSVATGDAGAGAGSVGWQAPEVMAQRWSPESTSNNEASESLMEASPVETPGANNRTSRSVDIFSLGCIFYCTILPGSHPFGEWYEREANIMKNSPNKEDLEFVSPDASDLILSMINRDPKARPTAEEVCDHPFFWSLSMRLKFLCEVSDRLELCDTSSSSHGDNDENDRPPALNIFAIEKGAGEIFGTSWKDKLDTELMEATLSRRTYDPSSVRDCLRMVRNKHHHYDELPAKLKARIGSSTEGLASYITRIFPRLLMHCYRFCVTNLASDDSLVVDYKLPVSKYLSLKSSPSKGTKAPVIADLSTLDDTKHHSQLETIPDEDIEQVENEETGHDEKTPELNEVPTLSEDETEEENAQGDLSGIVVWSGSNAAKELHCRGWYRADDEWMQRLDAKLRKPRDSNLAVCASDPKFRTRLCNYWDVNQGTFCPMKKKSKCIFAHGPVELRVKEGKRHRWGKLVNKHGLCANAKASGGEDTYGAARSIEKTRKEQGQWTVDAAKKKQVKGKPKGNQSPKKKKEQANS